MSKTRASAFLLCFLTSVVVGAKLYQKLLNIKRGANMTVYYMYFFRFENSLLQNTEISREMQEFHTFFIHYMCNLYA